MLSYCVGIHPPSPAFPPEAQGHLQQSRGNHRDRAGSALPQLRQLRLPAPHGEGVSSSTDSCITHDGPIGKPTWHEAERGRPPSLPSPWVGCEVRCLSGITWATLSISLPSWLSARLTEPGPHSVLHSHPQLHDSRSHVGAATGGLHGAAQGPGTRREQGALLPGQPGAWPCHSACSP